jgi:hypothetical protein
LEENWDLVFLGLGDHGGRYPARVKPDDSDYSVNLDEALESRDRLLRIVLVVLYYQS